MKGAGEVTKTCDVSRVPGDDSVFTVDEWPVTEMTAPVDVVLKGPLGDVVIRDNGNGVFDEGDGIDIVLERPRGDGQAQQLDQTGEEVQERLAEMGIKAIPSGTPLKPLQEYVKNLQEARKLARGDVEATAEEVEQKLGVARDAAIEAGVLVDGRVEHEIRENGEKPAIVNTYERMMRLESFSGLPFYDEARNDVEWKLDTAAIVGKAAGIPAGEIERDAQRVRYLLSQQSFVSALVFFNEGKTDAARTSITRAANFADMGGFEDEFEEMLAEEYGRLIFDPSLTGMTFIEVEKTLDVAAIFAKKAGISLEQIERDATSVRMSLCNWHYDVAETYAREGNVRAAEASRTLADNIADMGDLEKVFQKRCAQVDKIFSDLTRAKETFQSSVEEKSSGLAQLVRKIRDVLTLPAGTMLAKYESYAVRKHVAR